MINVDIDALDLSSMLTSEGDNRSTIECADCHYLGDHAVFDRVQLFADLTRRNAVRRQAQLPLLNIPAEYARAIELFRWKAICKHHRERVQGQVIAELARRLGREPQSAGGCWAIAALTLKRLRAIHHSTRPAVGRHLFSVFSRDSAAIRTRSTPPPTRTVWGINFALPADSGKRFKHGIEPTVLTTGGGTDKHIGAADSGNDGSNGR